MMIDRDEMVEKVMEGVALKAGSVAAGRILRALTELEAGAVRS